MKLQHLILSHHGERSFGAPVVPMTAEALVLHYLDNLDARLAEYYEQTDNITEANGKWTKWLESLERRFYKDKPKDNKLVTDSTD
jgi:3'-5' exoribonuclease